MRPRFILTYRGPDRPGILAHTAAQLVEIGRDVESVVLARAVRWHVEQRVAVDGVKTVVFE